MSAEEAAAWEAGLKAGLNYERARWQWSAGSISRAVNGLEERPERPENPYLTGDDSPEVV